MTGQGFEEGRGGRYSGAVEPVSSVLAVTHVFYYSCYFMPKKRTGRGGAPFALTALIGGMVIAQSGLARLIWLIISNFVAVKSWSLAPHKEIYIIRDG